MAKTNAYVHAFNAGEISRAAMARIDQEQVRLNAERQENLMPYVVGKAIMRPGLQHLTSTFNGASKIIPFVRSTETTALLEFGFDTNNNGILRVFVNDTLVTRPSVTSTISDPTFAC